MSGVTLYSFSDQQKADIRRFLGYPAYGTGNVIFPYPWVDKYFLALEIRLNTLSEAEGTIIVTTYLANLYTLESAIPAMTSIQQVDQAAVFKRNPNEMRERIALFNHWAKRLADFIGVPFGPGMASTGNNSVSLVV